MKKQSFALAMVCLFISQGFRAGAQYYYYNKSYYATNVNLELGGSVGIMNALTDIGGKKGTGKAFLKDLNLKTTRPSVGFYILATYKEAIGARLEMTFGSIHAYDSILKPVANTTFGRYERGLSFRSNITEIQLAAEIHPLFFRWYDEDKAPFLSPYLVAGIGYFTFNPESRMDGRWYPLQPLRTEGQGFKEFLGREPYKLSQISIPAGIGVRYEMSSMLNLRLEIVHRFLMTDYLDDVSEADYVDPSLFYVYLSPTQALLAEKFSNRSGLPYNKAQRGDPSDNDSFFTVLLKAGISIHAARR
jgi:hypothetical protein